jgi:hypothetical protein
MTNLFFVKFVKIWKKTFSLLASKVNSKIKIKVKIPLMITKSLNLKMVGYIMMNFCMYLMALYDFKYSKLGVML